MEQSFIYISYYVLIGALIVLGLVLFCIPVRKKGMETFSMSQKLITIAYISLGFYFIFKWRMPLELFNIPYLLVGHVQMNLLALCHFNLICPDKVTKKFVGHHLAPMFIMFLFYQIVYVFFPHVHIVSYQVLREVWTNPEVLIRLLWMGVYIVNIIYYTWYFTHLEHQYRAEAANYFSDDDMARNRLVRRSYVFALIVGYTSILITFCYLNLIASALFNVLIILAYTAMCICYMHYPSIFEQIKPLVKAENSMSDENCQSMQNQNYYLDIIEQNNISDDNHSLNRDAEQKASEQWKKLRQRIISDRLYVIEGLTMIQLAQELGISRSLLSGLINTQEHENFNTFINTLRVREAARMMSVKTDKSIAAIAAEVGYNDQSNFSRNFKKYIGATPAAFMQNPYSIPE